MFDCLEDNFNINEKENIYLVRRVKNKKKQKTNILYLSTISQSGKTEWTKEIKEAIRLHPFSYNYQIIRDTIRKYKIPCQIYRRIFVDTLNRTTKPQPVRKETWWDRFKVWFSRKFKEFITTPIDSSLPGED